MAWRPLPRLARPCAKREGEMRDSGVDPRAPHEVVARCRCRPKAASGEVMLTTGRTPKKTVLRSAGHNGASPSGRSTPKAAERLAAPTPIRTDADIEDVAEDRRLNEMRYGCGTSIDRLSPRTRKTSRRPKGNEASTPPRAQADAGVDGARDWRDSASDVVRLPCRRRERGELAQGRPSGAGRHQGDGRLTRNLGSMASRFNLAPCSSATALTRLRPRPLPGVVRLRSPR
jgi:hypothetical protein